MVDGEVKWVREQAELVFDAAGRLTSGTGTVQDVTEQYVAGVAQEESRRAAEAANRAKSKFLANMSHEIRTPMNAILGLTQLVLDDPLPEEQVKLLRMALDSGRALLGILNDILDYSKIEAGRLDIARTPFAVADVLREMGDLFSARLAEKGLALILDVDPALPAEVRGDPLRLSQVLINLIGNAIKFTERGEIRVHVAACPGAAPDQLTLRFAVRDTGIGIDREVADRLFEPFTQADGSITRKYGGTGLGLAICRRLVDLMGGTIAVSSAPGAGATFSFTIVVGIGAAASDAPSAAVDARSAPARRRFDGARVLVVEDNALNRQVAAGFLAKLGIVAGLADNGAAAVAMVEHGHFDAILMDVHMPVMDGLEATRRIRALPGGASIPVIAMTAAVLDEDRARCLEAGMVGFVPKPIDPDELLRVLGEHLASTPAAAPAAGGDTNAAPLPELPGFDLPAALRRLGGERALLERLLREFAAEHADFTARLAACLDAGELHDAARRLHTLKGIAANLGARRVAEAARQFETEVRAGNRPDLPACAARLRTALDEARAAIATLDAGKPAVPPPDPGEVAALLKALRPYLEARELLPDALLQQLAALACADANGPFARLMHQIDNFDHDGALVTLAQLAASLDPTQ